MLSTYSIFEFDALFAHRLAAQWILADGATSRTADSIAQGTLHEDLVVLDAIWKGSAEVVQMAASLILQLLEGLIATDGLKIGAANLLAEIAAGLTAKTAEFHAVIDLFDGRGVTGSSSVLVNAPAHHIRRLPMVRMVWVCFPGHRFTKLVQLKIVANVLVLPSNISKTRRRRIGSLRLLCSGSMPPRSDYIIEMAVQWRLREGTLVLQGSVVRSSCV